MADRSISLNLKANVLGFVNGMRTAKSAADDLAKSTSNGAATSESAARRIKTAADNVATAQNRAKDAAGRLKVAQEQLNAVQDSGNTVAITRATENLAKAERDAETATQKAADAQKAYQAALKDSGTEVETLSQRIERTQQSMEMVGGALMGAGGLMVGAFGMSVKAAADFERAMSSVKAATQETDENMVLLGEAAKRAGADTAFSAEEAAQGIEELAKAGVSTRDILAGGLDGALSLAAAGALDVGDAAEIAASAMVQFKLSGDELPHVADLLAAGAGKAQGSVKDLGEALNQSGLVAAQTGLDIEETTGTLAAFANAGLTGSDAGTSFKTMLQRLNPQSKAARELMDELGLSAYDAQGNFIGMEAYAGKLQGALSGMSQEQRNATMNTLFGSDAVRAAAVLYENGAEGIRQWTENVNDAGYAAKVASDMQDNLAGDLEKLGGSINGVFLTSGSAANDMLRDLTQRLEGFVDWVGRLPEGVLQVAGIFTGVAGGAAVLAGAALTVIPKINETRTALLELAPAGSKARGALAAIGKVGAVAGVLTALAAAAVQVHNAAQPATISLEGMGNALNGLSDGSLDTVNEAFNFESASNGAFAVGGLADALALLDVDTPAEGINRFGAEVLGIDNQTGRARDALAKLDGSLAALPADVAAEKMNQLRLEMEAAGRTDFSNWQDLKAALPDYAAKIEEAAAATGKHVDEADLFQAAMGNLPPVMQEAKDAAGEAAAGVGELGAAGEDAAVKTEDLVDALAETTGINPEGLNGMGEAMAILADESEEAGDKLNDVIDALFRAGMMHMSVQDAQAAMYEMTSNLNKAIEENGATLDLATEAGRANVDALQDAATTGMDAARAYAEAGQSQGTVRDALMQTYEELVRGHMAMGESAEAADVLSRRMLGIPEGVDIETSMDQQARIIAEATGQAIDAIPGYKGVELAVSDNGTAGSVQSKIDAVTGKESFVFVSDDGTTTTVQQQIQNISGVDRKVYVDDDGTIYGVQEDIDALTGTTREILIHDAGTTGEVQEQINEVTGKTEYILTTDDGTIRNVQRRIDNVNGVERTVYVDDDGTVYRTQREINDVDGKSVTIVAEASTSRAVSDIAYAARDRVVNFVARFLGGDPSQRSTSAYDTALAAGGIARLPAFDAGGRLPYTGLGTDMILGVTGGGRPIARVDDGEWIINERSSRKYHHLLDAINRNDPKLQGLPAFTAGGRAAGVEAGVDRPRARFADGGVVGRRFTSYLSQPRVTGAPAVASVQMPSQVTVRIGEQEFTGYVEAIGDRRLAQHVAGLAQPMRQYAGA